MKIDRVKISLINIATSVSFCCIILFGDNLLALVGNYLLDRRKEPAR